MIWIKTDAGRTEMQARARVKERAQRNLLLVIDGIKSEEMLLAGLAGISRDDFVALESFGLIATVATGSSLRSGNTVPGRLAAPPTHAHSQTAAEPVPLDYAQFTATLTQLISRELGLRGFVLTLAVEKASTIEGLQAVAQRVLVQIGERKGEAVAAAARRSLYGA